MGWDVPGGAFFELLESPDTSYAPRLSIPPELTYSVLTFPRRPPTRVIDNLSRLVSSCPVQRQVDVMSKKEASDSDQSDDDDDDSVTEVRAKSINGINGAMGLLRQQFPDIGALISCQWGAILQFDRADSQKWIQIINIRDNHWVMAAQGFGINPNNVLLYDSLDATEPHPHVLYCIAQLCKTPIGKLTISLMPCQVQKDGFNCGVYSIAFSTALAFNLNPSEMRFDTASMRNHLRECLLLKKMEPFPVLKSTIKCKNWRPKKIVSFDLFCKCQMPWYDPDCVVEKYKLLVVCKTYMQTLVSRWM